MATKEEEKEIKEQNKVMREKIASFFLDLGKLSFAALVLGIIAPLVTNDGNSASWVLIAFGLFLTVLMAFIGYSILKTKTR